GLVVIGATAGALMSQSRTLKDRFAAINDPENMRFRLWNAALEQFKLNPSWGTGSGTYLYHGRTFRDPVVQNDPIFVHNDYLHLLAEYGGIGVATFALFFIWHAAGGLRSVKRLAAAAADEGEVRSDGLALQIGSLSAIATYVAHSAVDFNLHIPANVLVMAFIFGMVATPALPRSINVGWRLFVARLVQVVALLVAGVILWRAVPLLPAEWHAEWSRQALRDRRLPEARAYAAKALAYDKGNPELYYYAGEATRETARLDPSKAAELGAEAIRLFEEGLKLFPFDSRLMLKLAQTYDQLRLFSKAEEWLERANEIDPNSMYVRSYYGMHYQAQEMWEEAEAEYLSALEMDTMGQNTIARAGLEQTRAALAPIRAAFQQEMPVIVDEEVTDPAPAPAPAPGSGSEIVPIR
ncbi:MAG TPA: tetratricopeptide repeat protein, partial [Chthoniobacteraceae bacterium]